MNFIPNGMYMEYVKCYGLNSLPALTGTSLWTETLHVHSINPESSTQGDLCSSLIDMGTKGVF